jgi:signal transduction histidine kinase
VPDSAGAKPGDAERSGLVQIHEAAADVFEVMPLGLVVFDRQLRAFRVNESARFLVQPDQSVAEVLAAATVESQYADWAAELRVVLESRLLRRFEHVTYQAEPDRRLILNLTCSPLTARDAADVLGGLLVVEDVTARIRMENRLAVSERMAALGKLAARVAHELNNPLDGILRYLGLAQRVIEEKRAERAIKYLAESRSGLLRMVQIVTDLLEFSRSAHASYENTSLNTILEEAVKAMGASAAESGVSVVCSFEGPLPVLRGGGNMFQVFCNIIKNAMDAMPGGGTLTITSKLGERDVIIRFDDTGPGLPEDAERIFEPFFTTKPAGKGTGLGLPICRDIVEKYHGRLTAENCARGGARFTIHIPRESCAPMSPKGAGPQRGPRPAGGSPDG